MRVGHNALGQFLRARVDPASWGLPRGPRGLRGLRREEVAMVAGSARRISPVWNKAGTATPLTRWSSLARALALGAPLWPKHPAVVIGRCR